jgi:hypothetical protein
MEVHMPANDKQRFNYSGLSDEKAKELRSIAATLQPLLKQLHPTALKAGQYLRAAKEILQYGGFGTFCRDVMKTDVRLCQYYIRIADLSDEIGSEFVERMPASSAAALSSAPSEIVGQVVNEMKDGGPCPSVRKIKERVQEARGNGDSVATVEHHDEHVASIASALTQKLERQELADLMDLLNAGHKSIVALCDKIHSHLASSKLVAPLKEARRL